jgi:two-component system, LuxR family, response regulator FixJ
MEGDSTSSPAGESERWVGIVDDDPSVRGSIARVLRIEGICAEAFASGEEFLARVALGAPECIVLDVHLGEHTGFDVQDRLAGAGASPPIIFITAHDEIPSSRLAARHGPTDYLRKPFDTAALIALIRPHLLQELPQGVGG